MKFTEAKISVMTLAEVQYVIEQRHLLTEVQYVIYTVTSLTVQRYNMS